LLLASSAEAQGLGAPQDAPDRIAIEPREDLLELAWSDTEERLQGSIHPAVPREGEPLQVTIQLGSFQGAAFEGPITLTLREEGNIHGKTLTVPRGERHWQATFIPETTGLHRLDVSFRTTHYKALHAAFRVEDSRVPRMVGWGLLGLCALGLIGYTVRHLLKEARPAEPSPAPAPEVSPASTVASPPAELATPGADPTPADAAAPENKPPEPQ
jgi:hypothetical protein